MSLERVREADRMMVETKGIGLLQMMKNAGRSLTELARRSWGGSLAGKIVTVLFGPVTTDAVALQYRPRLSMM